MRNVQADSYLNSEQNGTLFISVGGQERFRGWVVILGWRSKIWTCLSTIFFYAFCRDRKLYLAVTRKTDKTFSHIFHFIL
jgi:hypothetical protein